MGAGLGAGVLTGGASHDPCDARSSAPPRRSPHEPSDGIADPARACGCVVRGDGYRDPLRRVETDGLRPEIPFVRAMTAAVIGSEDIGARLARCLTAVGHVARVSNSCGALRP